MRDDDRDDADKTDTDKPRRWLEGLTRQPLLAGYEDGRYELRRQQDRRLGSPVLEDPLKRDNRVNVRVAAPDLQALQRQSLKDGVPLQSLLASIIHQYVREQLGEYLPDEEAESAGNSDDPGGQGLAENSKQDILDNKKPLPVVPPRKG